jgi:hypothetical protein
MMPADGRLDIPYAATAFAASSASGCFQSFNRG